MTEPINLIHDGKIIGTIRDDTFYKTIDSDKHLLRKPPAIAIQATAIQYLMTHGVKYIEVQDSKHSRSFWRCTLNQFLAGKFSFNRGFGEQYALPLDKWNQPEINYQTRFGANE